MKNNFSLYYNGAFPYIITQVGSGCFSSFCFIRVAPLYNRGRRGVAFMEISCINKLHVELMPCNRLIPCSFCYSKINMYMIMNFAVFEVIVILKTPFLLASLDNKR